MRCPTCGSPTNVLETRTCFDGFVLERKRKCFENHTYSTFELSGSIERTLTRAVLHFVDGCKRRAVAYRRDRSIVNAVKKGIPLKDVAAEYGIKSNSVSAVLRKKGVPDRRKAPRVEVEDERRHPAFSDHKHTDKDGER